MAITAADVKKLRDATGAGMMDAKKALTEAEGDHEKAIELLRISGLAKAAKRTDREATNGIVAGRDGVLIQLAAETDFVAKNAEFTGCCATRLSRPSPLLAPRTWRRLRPPRWAPRMSRRRCSRWQRRSARTCRW